MKGAMKMRMIPPTMQVERKTLVQVPHSATRTKGVLTRVVSIRASRQENVLKLTTFGAAWPPQQAQVAC